MARSMWRGAVQFGLVTIPVRLYLATEARGGLSFNLLHKTCLTRIQMKTYCPFHEEYIDRADTVRGYEYAKGQYVVIEDADLEAVPLKTVRAIEIEMFVDARRDAQGAQFVRQAYYLEPEPVGRKAFYLLKHVLADAGKSAICKIVLKDREHLAALNPYASTMLLTTLYWPDEVRKIDDLELPEAEFEFRPAELRMAEQLVAAMTGEFTADDYRDDYRQALMAVIESKITGMPEPREIAPEPTTKLGDLMAALEASVAAAREQRQDMAQSGDAESRPRRSARRAADPDGTEPRTRRDRREAEADVTPVARKPEADGRRSRRTADAPEPARVERKRKTA